MTHIFVDIYYGCTDPDFGIEAIAVEADAEIVHVETLCGTEKGEQE